MRLSSYCSLEDFENFFLIDSVWLCCAVGAVDLCSLGDANSPQVDSKAYEDALHENSIPQAGKKAGVFHKYKEIDDWISCVVMCCERQECDVVLFFNETCYMIECNVSISQGCEPVQRPNLTSTMVIVRQPREYSLHFSFLLIFYFCYWYFLLILSFL
jgi:hypothetical protein